jgi:hypothetical protein
VRKGGFDDHIFHGFDRLRFTGRSSSSLQPLDGGEGFAREGEVTFESVEVRPLQDPRR